MPLSFKLMGAGIVLTLVGFFMSLSSLRLAIWGKPAKAEIVHAIERTKRRSDRVTHVAVSYRFRDDKGEDVLGGVNMPPGYVPPADAQLDVVYVSGASKTNRLASKSGWTGYLCLLGGLALSGIGFWYFNVETVNEAHAETARTMEGAQRRTLLGR